MRPLPFLLLPILTLLGLTSALKALKYNTAAMTLSNSFVISSKPKTRTYNFEVDEVVGAPDGFQRNLFVINGLLEGPVIEANTGDTIIVNVKNNLPMGVTFHWHGISQNGTQWADGPNGVTQCPIPPNKSFQYKFSLTRKDQYGTYWYHAHKAAMYADGLAGPLIVHSPHEPLQRGRDYAVDQVIFLRDWYHNMSQVITDGLLSTAGFDGTFVAPSPKSGLINGRGSYNCSFAPKDTHCSATKPLEISVRPGIRTRLRFINAGAHAEFKVSVDQHPLTLIEADDTPLKGVSVQRIPISIAQRYSAILDTTHDGHGSSFYLRAQINTNCFGAPFADLDTDVKAIIRVVAPDALPSTKTPTSSDWRSAVDGTCVDFEDSLLVPSVVQQPPRVSTRQGVFNASFAFTQVGDFVWTLNGVAFEDFMNNPLLFQVASGGSLNQSQVSVLESDSINTFDMIINNQQLVDHPFHLHALKFWVVARGNGTMSPAGLKHVKLNLNNPIRRDVTVVAGGGWAVLRFITDIPGVHLFHCHILWHQVVGLGGVFVSQRPEILEMKFPQETLNLCAAENWAPGTSKNTTAVGSMKRAKVQAQKRVALRLEAGKKEKKRGTGHWSERLGRKLSKVARKVVCLKGSTTGARIGA